ncbi:MAG: DUF1836 domain-containing protein [Elusimicrobiales bacterium]|nr:DUF1836 domain-containing protein [Elusimicrobiales bacterium]
MQRDDKTLDIELAAEAVPEESKAALKAQLDLFRRRRMDFKFHMPLYGELTSFPLYMSQLLDLLDETLSPFMIPGEEQIITKSMINNYVQKKVILPPVNKKYNKVHIIHLIAIGVLKQVISIEEITQIIHMQLDRYPKISIAYNYFCRALEEALSKAFNNVEVQNINRKKRTPTLLSELVDSCLLTFAHRIYVKKALFAARPKNYDKRIKTPVKLIMSPKNFKEKRD